ncbi:unnamed protein product [Ostreobium quekettii]|uniref:Kinesin-like protein n=1 Tax=Ostreobium quekettii TaxID=121088 RepID=A0A8S1IUW7_9CHLO|nr:unnamed protein product [Ostreobium quekettii]
MAEGVQDGGSSVGQGVGVKPLAALASMRETFQADAFQRALLRSGQTLPRRRQTVDESENPPFPEKEGFTADDMLLHSPDTIPTSLLHLSNENISRAVKMFGAILRYQGHGSDPVDVGQRVELAAKLVHSGIKRPDLKDELYMQLMKQTRGNPVEESKIRAWELLLVVASAIPPNKDFVALMSEYINAVPQSMQESEAVKALSKRVWTSLKRCAKAGPRRTPIGHDEIEALLEDRKLSTDVDLLDGTSQKLHYDITTTVQEGVEALAAAIDLKNYSTFTLFESKPPPKSDNAEAALVMTAEHTALDENRYVADSLSDMRIKGGGRSLLFKKLMFRANDEMITEPQFVSLSYVQAQHDYLLGNYPVVRDDAAEMCALQIYAEHGTVLADAGQAFVKEVESHITKQVLMTRPREEWRQDVHRRYLALFSLSQNDAKGQFLKILRTLPYGNSVFFMVKRIEDPIGLLPSKLIFGINRRGVHFFRPVPKEYLHSAELRDIMQFGSSSQAVFFKMRVAGVLHIFQFESKQGEDICMALQTHISDIMMKKYSKGKQLTSSAPDRPSGAAGLAQANFGPKYEQHMKQMQEAVSESETKIEDQVKVVQGLEYEEEKALEELKAVKESLTEEEAKKNALQAEVDGMRAELEKYRMELSEVNATIAAGEAQRQAAVDKVKENNDSAQVREIQKLLELKEHEAEDVSNRIQTLKADAEAAEAERATVMELLAEKEKDKDECVGDLSRQLKELQVNSKAAMKAKDDKINSAMEKLANITAMYNENLADLEQMKEEQKEVSELRELKREIESREREQAMVIEQQAKKLEEMEHDYKTEQVQRKRIFNQMEDMKGKIRVYARVRPILPFESAKGQTCAVTVQDELTLSHFWKDEKKPREYCFDQVFPQDSTQEDIFEGTKHLVQSAVDGYNVCIFAYGQTGSGKTHTIYGDAEHPGLTPRGIRQLFAVLERDSGKFTSSVTCYMLEIYQDAMVDLLASHPSTVATAASSSPPPKSGQQNKEPPPKLEIKRDAMGMVVVQGAALVEVTSPEQLLETIEWGQRRRHVSETQMNRASSRSHLIMSFIVESTNLQTQVVSRGKLSFVDLAGSERVKKSGSTGETLKEAQAINKSLSALGDVISALATSQAHIPYRNHKLTMLMSDSLGGNAKTLMFVNASPTNANIDETQNSLQYATRVRTIKNDASKNECSKDAARLRKQIDRWKEQAGLKPEERDVVGILRAFGEAEE